MNQSKMNLDGTILESIDLNGYRYNFKYSNEISMTNIFFSGFKWNKNTPKLKKTTNWQWKRRAPPQLESMWRLSTNSLLNQTTGMRREIPRCDVRAIVHANIRLFVEESECLRGYGVNNPMKMVNGTILKLFLACLIIRSSTSIQVDWDMGGGGGKKSNFIAPFLGVGNRGPFKWQISGFKVHIIRHRSCCSHYTP